MVLVSHTLVFVYMRVFGNYYILFGVCRNEENQRETTDDN